MMWRRKAAILVGMVAVLVGGALLRGWLVPASRSDLSPEAYGWRLRWPWAPAAEVTVYYPTGDGGALVAVRRTVAQATPLAALRELAAGPAPGSGLQPALPAGLAVDGVTLDGTTAVVKVSGAEPDAGAQAVMARTLQGYAEAVHVLLPAGKALGPVPVPPAAAGQVAFLWRGLPVPVAAELPDGADRPAAAVRRVLAGPAPAGVDPMPEGVSLIGIEVKGDLAKVSLDLTPAVTEELTAGRWQFAPHAMAIVDTLTMQPGIRRVQFDFPNLPAAARRNCRTPLGVPLVRPDAEKGRAKGA